MTLCSCVVGTFGLLLSKAAHVYDNDLPLQLQEPNLYRRPLAWVGIMIILIIGASAMSCVYLYLARKRMKEVGARAR